MITNRSDLEYLVRQHQGALYRYVRFLGAPPAGAEDLVQETFLATLKPNPNHPADREDLRWPAWLRGIARHLYLAECRRRVNYAAILDDPELLRADAARVAATTPDSLWTDQLLALQECLKILPARQRSALDLRYTQAVARDEMARRLAMSEDGVKTLLRRIRAALARCVQERLSLMKAP